MWQQQLQRPQALWQLQLHQERLSLLCLLLQSCLCCQVVIALTCHHHPHQHYQQQFRQQQQVVQLPAVPPWPQVAVAAAVVLAVAGRSDASG